jgi:predicted double-glycine peptidase
MKKAPALLLAAIIAVAAGWIAGTLVPLPLATKPPAPRSVAPSPSAAVPDSLLASVPDVRQSTGYTCGVAALQAVLAHWGTSEREDRLAARLHSTPEAGTHPAEIVRVAMEFGLSAELREGLSLADLEAALAAGTSVIVDLQAWRDKTDIPWTETWEDGHYMVLLGVDASNLYFEDPSLLGVRGVIPRAEFVDRWHDYEGDPPLDPTDRKYVHVAILIRGNGPAPAPPAPFTRVH